ncbi:hypothetical protein ACWKWU_16200 [Chitinophaga lutea]
MKKLLAVLLLGAVVSCSTTTRITDFYKGQPPSQGKTYHTIFVAALVHNLGAKASIENNVAAAAKARGYEVVKSGDVFPPNFTRENVPDRETILSKVKASGCDAIYTVTLVNKESETRYVPGTGPYAPYPRWGWYGSFWGYYSYWSPMMYDPGYYTTDKTYYMETNLYDAQTEQLLFSVQSATVNPNGIEDFSKSYTAAIVRELGAQGLLK